jgi:UDP:flavonoid glycosyltransferase YjiC (YdhE family)
MGEYARSAAIARAALARWPRASVHFVLSRKAPYAADTPFPATLLASSATFHSAAVIDLIRSWRPHVVVFDNAGRGAQLKAARRLGARVIYISARRRQRRKAFRLGWMRVLDEHWIAYPKFIAGEPRLLERLKLRLVGRPTVRYLDVILSRAPAAQTVDSLAQVESSSASASAATNPQPAGLETRRDEVLVVPGGGTGHPGARGALEQFWNAASSLAASGYATRFVGRAPSGSEDCALANLQALDALPQSDLAHLMSRARLIVVNGGSTLLQSIACGAACVAAPIANDQRERIRRCAAAGVAIEAALSAADLSLKAKALLSDEPARAALAQRAAGLGLADGIAVAIAALGTLIENQLIENQSTEN